MKWIQNYIKSLSYIGIGIIGILIINSILFTHIHALPNGSFIIHAHPYSQDNPPSTHNHSDSEIVILNNITFIFFYGVLSIFFIVHTTNKKIQDTLPIKYVNRLFIQKFGRAPPVQNYLLHF